MEMNTLDTKRAREIMNSGETIQVLYQGSPVWLNGVKDNNVADITRMDRQEKLEVPVYLLVENSPVRND
jgi:H-type small acid-soluble spore protein